MRLTFAPTKDSDAETLVRIRISAMQESLERVGRFDPQRARDRFLSSFEPSQCTFIIVDGQQVGFVSITLAPDHIALDHLYITPGNQRKGIGALVLASIFRQADEKSLPLTVGALRDSDSIRFYMRHGFTKTGESDWDIYFIRIPIDNKSRNLS